MRVGVDVREQLAVKFEVLLPHLNERQRRLYLASEARSLGHGGVAAVAAASGVTRQTVVAGVADLEAGHQPLGRVRRPGAGRKHATNVDRGLKPVLLALVDPEARGDPESPLRWTTKSLRKLAGELTAAGHAAGPDLVGRLLREEKFSRQANAKTREGGQHPDRDGQFRSINEQVRQFQAAGNPVISVDAKKKELVGDFKNNGRTWRPQGTPSRCGCMTSWTRIWAR